MRISKKALAKVICKALLHAGELTIAYSLGSAVTAMSYEKKLKALQKQLINLADEMKSSMKKEHDVSDSDKEEAKNPVQNESPKNQTNMHTAHSIIQDNQYDIIQDESNERVNPMLELEPDDSDYFSLPEDLICSPEEFAVDYLPPPGLKGVGSPPYIIGLDQLGEVVGFKNVEYVFYNDHILTDEMGDVIPASEIDSKIGPEALEALEAEDEVIVRNEHNHLDIVIVKSVDSYMDS